MFSKRTSRNSSISSTSTTSLSSTSSIWNKIARLLSKKKPSHDSCDSSLASSTSILTSSSSIHSDDKKRKRKQLIHTDDSANLMIPPFSPTYCKPNEFPYSNFYIKLPNGKWMVRYRDGNRGILRTDIMEGYMI